jgi:hypothetical protein
MGILKKAYSILIGLIYPDQIPDGSKQEYWLT